MRRPVALLSPAFLFAFLAQVAPHLVHHVFEPDHAAPESDLTEMPRFYGQVIASLVQRAAVLFDVGVLKRGEAA